MGRFSPDGQFLSGNGAAISVDGRVLHARGSGVQWWFDEVINAWTAIAQIDIGGDVWRVASYRHGHWVPILPHGANAIAVSHDRFAAVFNRQVVLNYPWPASLPPTALLPHDDDGRGAGSRDGTLGFVANAEGRGLLLQRRNGTTSAVPGVTVARDIQLLWDDAAIWDDGAGHISTHIVRVGELLPGAARVKYAVVKHIAWVAYFSRVLELYVAHPVNDLEHGRIVSHPPFYHFDIWQPADGSRLIVGASRGPQELPHENVTIDPINDLPVTNLRELLPADPIVPIGRECWVVWYEHGHPATPPPGNAILNAWTLNQIPQTVIVNGVPMSFGKLAGMDGQVFADYIHALKGTPIEAIEASAAASPIPVFAYYDDHHWPRWPNLRPDDYVSVRGYWPKGMTLAALEADMRAQCAAVPPGPWIALNCQCYDNPDLESNLAALVPMFSRIARDVPRVRMLAVFNDAGRQNTGLQGHPEVRSLWAQLAATVQTPQPKPPKPEPPKDPPMTLPSLDRWINHEFPQLVAAYKRAHPELGEPGAEWSAFQTARRGVGVPEGRWAFVDMLHHEITGEPNRGSKPEPLPDLDGWINREFPQLVEAYKQGHPDLGEPGSEWAAFQTARRGMVVPEGRWSFEKMLAHEQGQAGPGPIEPRPPGSGPTVNGRLSIDGRMLRDGTGSFYRPVWSSALAILTREHEPFLNWLVETGFNGCRVFGGRLSWAGQSPENARHQLPIFLQLAEDRGLRVEVTALTDTKDGGYDARAHVREMAAICDAFENAILEASNEPWHPTQEGLTPAFLASLRNEVPSGVLYALGAADSDEDDAYAGGQFVTAHLDRGRDEWNMVRRVRELEALSDRTRKPVLNNEPIKFGSQNANPSIAFTMGVLNRIFEVGGVCHSDDGLQGVIHHGSISDVMSHAFVEGSRLIEEPERLTFKNAGWNDSPVEGASFDNAVRVYSGVVGNRGWTVALGLKGDPEIRWQNGWRVAEQIAARPGVNVYKIER